MAATDTRQSEPSNDCAALRERPSPVLRMASPAKARGRKQISKVQRTVAVSERKFTRVLLRAGDGIARRVLGRAAQPANRRLQKQTRSLATEESRSQLQGQPIQQGAIESPRA